MKIKKIISRNLRKITHQSTASLRVVPDFFVVGSSRTGKTTLLNYLTQHPNIIRSYRIETSYFDINYKHGINWYKSNFPTKSKINSLKLSTKMDVHIGESIHMHSSFVPERIHQIIPNPKIIFLVRNPIDRAYSYYQKSVEIGSETLSFLEALQEEENRINDDQKKFNLTPEYYENFRQWYLYKTNGKYIELLKNWINFFPKNNMLFLKSEDFFKNSKLVVNQVCDFLQINHIENLKTKDFLQNQQSSNVEKSTRKILEEYYEPFNLELYEFIGKNLNWE